MWAEWNKRAIQDSNLLENARLFEEIRGGEAKPEAVSELTSALAKQLSADELASWLALGVLLCEGQ